MIKLKNRRLGRSNISVSPIGIGGLAMGGAWTHSGDYFHYGSINDEESVKSIQ